jgi:hypothetical protein
MKRRAGWSLATVLFVVSAASAQSTSLSLDGGLVAGVQQAGVPQLRVNSDAHGWDVVASELPKEAVTMLFLGFPPAPGQSTTVYFGIWGSVDLEMDYFGYAFMMSPVGSGESASLYFARPKPLPPALDGVVIALQAVATVFPDQPLGSQAPLPLTFLVSAVVGVKLEG